MRSLALILAGALLAAASSQAHAHARLTESVPADGDRLEQAPEEIVLEFSEPVRLTVVAVARTGGEQQALGPLPSARETRFAVATPELEPGEYMLTWRAVSADTHVISGELTFTVSPTRAASRQTRPAG